MTPSVPAPCRLYLGTEDGLRTARLTPDGLEIDHEALHGEAVRAVDVHPDDTDDALVGCGLRGWGLHRTDDGGATVESLGFEERWVWGVARHPDDPETVYVGTEPPMLYRSTDAGATFEAFGAIDDLPSRPEWTFFHDPFRAGHVHGIAIHPERPERILAGVEHGALIASPDGGETWTESLVGSDVHRVAVDPADPDRGFASDRKEASEGSSGRSPDGVFAATGSGLYRSTDGGGTWHPTPDLEGRYLHAVVFHPDDPGRMLVYAADADSPVHASEDGGDSWTPVAEGLPSARPADALRLHPADPETLLYVGDADDGTSHLYVGTDGGASWERVETALPKVWRLAVAPAP